MREDQLDERHTEGSAENGYTIRIRPAPLGVGRIIGLDPAYVDGSETLSERRRWPNRYFAAQGLFSLVAAHAAVVQSSPR